MSNETLLYFDQHSRLAYRITAKRLTVGEGVAVDSEQDEIVQRPELSSRQLLALQHYPLVKHGLSQFDSVQLDDEPEFDGDGNPVLADDLDWHPVELTEKSYLELDELVSLVARGAVIKANPHRDPSYEALKKAFRRESHRPANQPPLSESATTDNSNAND